MLSGAACARVCVCVLGRWGHSLMCLNDYFGVKKLASFSLWNACLAHGPFLSISINFLRQGASP